MPNNTPVTSIRSNSIPQGGVTALQSVPPEQMPVEIAQLLDSMTPVMTRFRESSSPQNVKLGSMSFTEAGDEDSIRITSLGLGWRIRSHHAVEFLVSNSATTASVVNISKAFPYDLLANTNVQINGGTSTYSASGRSGLVVYGRTHRGFFTPQNNALNQALVRVSFGAGLTPTASSELTFSGYDSFSIAASTSDATLQVDFYTFEKLAYSEDTLLGALPLQNNSVYATVTRKLISSFTGKDASRPFYVAAGVPATTTVTLKSYNVDQWYDYWSVPNNPALYAPMVNNSYQIQEQQNLTAQSTGQEGFVYDLPQNQFAIAAHIFGRDSANNPMAWDALDPIRIVYNGGSLIPVVMDAGNTRSWQFGVYGADIMAIPGYRLWDGDATTDNITLSDEAGWINTYQAASPQLVADVADAASVPLNLSVTREVVIAGAVKTIG